MAAAGAWAAGAGQNKPDDGKADILIIPSSPWTGASFALSEHEHLSRFVLTGSSV